MVSDTATKFYGRFKLPLDNFFLFLKDNIGSFRTELTTKAALQPLVMKANAHNFYQPNVSMKGMRSAQVHISYLSKQV